MGGYTLLLGSGRKAPLVHNLPEPQLPVPLGDIALPVRLASPGAPPAPASVVDPVRPAGTLALTVLNARYQQGIATGTAILDGNNLTLVRWLPWETNLQAATRIGHELALPSGPYVVRACPDASLAASAWVNSASVEVRAGSAATVQLDAITHPVVVSASAAGEVLREGTPLQLRREGDPTWRTTVDGRPPAIGAENLLRLQLGPGAYELAPLAWGGAPFRFTVPARDAVRADFAR